MANLDFPQNPEVGQEYKGPKGKSYWWDGVKWAVKRPVIVTPVPEPAPEPDPVVAPVPALAPAPDIMLMSVIPLTGGIDFPPSPVRGDKFLASSGITYEWDGVKWVINQNIIIDNGGGGGGGGGNYVLPTATNTRLGGVRIGSGIINQNGLISLDLQVSKGDKGDTGYTGPPGNNGLSAYQIAVNNGFVGTIEAWLASLKGENGNASTVASGQAPGIVKIGSNINVTQNGTISVPVATNSTLGVVKPGANVNIDGSGAISVAKGAGINTVTDIPDVNSTAGGAALNDGALLIYNASNNRWDTVNNLRSDEMDGGFF